MDQRLGLNWYGERQPCNWLLSFAPSNQLSYSLTASPVMFACQSPATTPRSTRHSPKNLGSVGDTRLPRPSLPWLIGLLILAVNCGAQSPADDQVIEFKFTAADSEWFEREVRPILAEHCTGCHSDRVGKSKGDLSLDTRDSLLTGGESGPAVVPGRPDQSLLIEAVRRESFEMPPEKPLSDLELRTLERWVERGAPWGAAMPTTADSQDWLQTRMRQHWVWQPVRKVTPPIIEDDNWSRNAIDRFIYQGLRANNLRPAADCPPEALVRRLSFDLVGLPSQTALASTAFSRSDTPATGLDADRYRQLVDQLMASPQFGARWGRHWLDLVRYAETLGHEFDYPLHHAWRYRDAIIDAFNTDLPYDRLVVEQLAGDQVSEPRFHPQTGVNQSHVLSGFWWLGESVHAPVDVTGDWATRVDNQIDVFSKTFLGLTVACARCHDHKFDALGVEDYYGLAGVIESSRREYAISDPHAAIAQHQQRIRQARVAAESDSLSASIVANSLTSDPVASNTPAADDPVISNLPNDVREHGRRWIEQTLARLRAMKPKDRSAALPPTSPLWPLSALLSERPLSKAWQALRTQAQRNEREYVEWTAESVLFAQFDNGLPEGWRLRGLPSDSCGNWDWFSTTLPLPRLPRMFASQSLGRHQWVSLESPDFEVTHPAVCLQVRGQAAESSVVVSNYFMQEFHTLLFGDLKKTIDEPHDNRWLTHQGDLNKYIGHSAYLSLQDRRDAWFEIAEIRFADGPPPPRPAQFAMQLLKSEPADDQELMRAMGDAVASSLLEPLPESSSRLELRRSLLQLADDDPPAWLRLSDDLTKHNDQLQQLDQQTPQPTLLLATYDGTPRDAPVDIRGNPHDHGDVIPRGCLVSLDISRPAAETSSGRMELAQSLMDPAHPLTARVIVNRVWQHLMGRGLVRSPDNLGVLGGRPTHPELLDYLSLQFQQHDWSIKWLVREIVTSRTYQLSSFPSESHRQHDADGGLWSHRSVRRLTAEALRDTLLATSGSLDIRLGGRSIPVHLNDQMTGRGRPKSSGPLDGSGRRSVYVEVRRNFLDPFLLAFDFPMPATTAGSRNQSNVPAQALGLLNDPLVVELSKRWVARTASITDPRARVEAMIETAFGRSARPTEIDQCMTLVDQLGPAAWQELAGVLFNSKEYSFIP